MVITPLSLEGHHGPAILQIRTWSLYHSGAFLELTLLLEEFPQIAGEFRLLRGISRLRSGNLEGGKSDLQFLWWSEPDTIFGLAALRELAASNLPGTYNLQERKLIKRRVPEISYVSHRTQSTKKVAAIRQKLRRKTPRRGVLATELLYASGLELLHHEEFRQASKTLSRALRAKPPSPLKQVIELNLAKALRFRGAYETALKHFDTVAKDKNRELRYQALSQAGQMAIHYRRYNDAQKRFEELLLTNPLGPSREDALWGLGWVSFRKSKFAKAQQFFQALFEENPYGPQAPRALYWNARSHQKLKQNSEAAGQLHALLERFPVDYYAHRASKLLERFRKQGVLSTPATLPNKNLDPRVAHIEGLAKSDLKSKTRRALSSIIDYARQNLGPIELDLLASIADSFRLTSLRGRFQGIRHRRFPEANRSAIRTLAANFPRTYVNLLRKAARRNKVEESLLVALARQESAFNPKAVSSAGALGLLQLMPRTAASMIREKKKADELTTEDILNPQLNAKLGSKYLRRMLNAYGGKTEYALAAYNAGPGSVNRWRRTYGNLPVEVFVEEIPYKETREYVRRVLAWKRKYSFMHQHRKKLRQPKKAEQTRRSKKSSPRG